MKKEILTMVGVGDCAPYRKDLASSFRHVAPLLRGADLTFGQLEAVLSLQGTPSSCTRMPCSSRPEVAPVMREAGFDVVSFASNHALDYGREAFCETLQHLREAGLAVTGAGENEESARRYPVLDVKGTKVAVLGYCSILPQGFWAQEQRPGCNPARGLTAYAAVEHDQPGTPCRIYTFPHPEDLQHMIEDIEQARREADVVIVSMHWGIHFKEAEIAEYQRYYAHFAIDHGADLVLGHHAHILKPIEIYKGRVIFYSLGNFAMEEVTDMLRDQATLHQDMATSKNHREMTAISDAFAVTKRSFPMDCYYTMIAKWTVEEGKISRVSCLPAYLPEDGAPYVVKREDPLFDEILSYMEKITEKEKLDTRYSVCGDEIVLAEGVAG
ncbi:MAG: CapA family protein [Lachnospiraceae bacterium]|nr:CapA family protein [Lachnospiraceae bacterium]